MFDSTYISPRIDGTSTKTVHEHRAPTDDSVRLLREMEKKAQEQIEKAVRLENSPIDAVIHKQLQVLTGDTLYAVLFKINGKQIRADHIARDFDSQENTVIAVRDAIAVLVANEIMQSVASAMRKII